ncbi:MAG: hypothetical protein HYS81_01550 [Candidatus Aenigmatarchaeota archaeon]|nr:MAG: hypothetical protein HYS81_01550 [Candidatus Aenigmarchaeota archaeon]
MSLHGDENLRSIKVWPLGELPADSIDLVNEDGDIVLTVASMNPEDDNGPAALIDDKCVHVLVSDDEVTRRVIERELAALTKAMNVAWTYVDSDEKLVEFLETAKRNLH